MNAKNTILSLSIAVVYFFFIVYTTTLIYPKPKFSDYCIPKPIPQDDMTTQIAYTTKWGCEARGGKWFPSPKTENSTDPLKEPGWCDLNFYCSQEYRKALEEYSRNLFFITLILGTAVIILFSAIHLEIISAGLSLGSIFLIIFGTLQNWGNFSKASKTALLGISLAILIFFSLKLTKRHPSQSNNSNQSQPNNRRKSNKKVK